jgi:hypothetical protein
MSRVGPSAIASDEKPGPIRKKRNQLERAMSARGKFATVIQQ